MKSEYIEYITDTKNVLKTGVKCTRSVLKMNSEYIKIRFLAV